MAEKTTISWTTSTFNPWTGCTKISPGCVPCYAAAWARRTNLVKWGKGQPRRRTTPAIWRGPLRWNQEAAKTGKPWRVFCASLADVFDDEAPDEWRTALWALIEATPYLTWQLLTKRPENIMPMVPRAWRERIPAHVWMGTSVEDQQRADERIPHLLRVPAKVRFLSCEPLLGRIVLEEVAGRHWLGPASQSRGMNDGVSWVIVGGESGPGYRPMDIAWAIFLRNQCYDAKVPFFMKQGSGPVSGLPSGNPVLDRQREFPEVRT